MILVSQNEDQWYQFTTPVRILVYVNLAKNGFKKTQRNRERQRLNTGVTIMVLSVRPRPLAAVRCLQDQAKSVGRTPV